MPGEGPPKRKHTDYRQRCRDCEEKGSGRDSIANPELTLTPPTTYSGHNVTIRCISRAGSFPITYSLFLTVDGSKTRSAAFSITIYNSSSLGPYKCKANNSVTPNGAYSTEHTFTLLEPLSIPDLTAEPTSATIEQNVTIQCLSREGSFPITYSLYHNRKTVGRTNMTEARPSIFPIYNLSSLGPYKCKATNIATPNGTYSPEFTFPRQDSIANPELTLIPSTTYSGHNVTISCLSRSGSLPITYSLFRNMTYIGAITVEFSRTRSATFNITIHNSSSLGPYKCKANNSASPNGTYSIEHTFTLLEPLSNPELTADPTNAIIGQNVTIQCLSRNGSFPITYSLYHNRKSIGRMNMTEAGPAIFILYNLSSLGPYKCKAMNNATPNGAYSSEFTFPRHKPESDGHEQSGQRGNIWTVLAWLLPLLILVIIIAALVFIMAKNRRKWRSSVIKTPQDHNTYAAVSAAETGQCPSEVEEVQYCTLALEKGGPNQRPIMKKTPQDHMVYDAVSGPETGRCPSEAEEVQYCTLALGEGGPKVIKTEESVEYSAIARSQPQVS